MYNETKYSRGIIDNLSDISIARLANPQIGETVFCRENSRVLTWDGDIWMCDDFLKMRNLSGLNLIAGDVVVAITTSGTEPAFAVVGSSNPDPRILGPLVFNCNSGILGAVAYKGIYRVNFNNGTNRAVFAGDLVVTGTSAGKARMIRYRYDDPELGNERLFPIIGFAIHDSRFNSESVIGPISGSIKCFIQKNPHSI